MGAPKGNPPFICCADCGAALRAQWRPFVDSVFEAHGRCPNCSRIVVGFCSDDPEALDDLSALALEAFPGAHHSVCYRPSGFGGAGPS